MNTKVQKWGNSLAVRLPKRMVERLHLTEGHSVELAEENGVVTMVPVHPPIKKTHSLKDWPKFIIPSGRKKGAGRASEQVDEIVYGASR